MQYKHFADDFVWLPKIPEVNLNENSAQESISVELPYFIGAGGLNHYSKSISSSVSFNGNIDLIDFVTNLKF
jgi:hypothetical protein